ncbi:MAG TPA: hypothetical protein VKY40_10625 [Halanaerobiales bacterium]|nr:hypothetical protein [Halanaerobiales bacterium]
MKRLLVILFIGMVLLISTAALAEDILININVEAMQELRVNKEAAISFTYPREGLDEGEAIIFNNVGEIDILSNVDWNLSVSLRQVERELEVWLRPAGTYEEDWQRIDNAAALLAGKKGSQSLSWDIKVVPVRDSYTLLNRNMAGDASISKQKNFQLIYTLTQN